MAGQVVVITGASAGVGRATAVAFGTRGDAVALLARGADGLAATAADVEAAGGSALIVECDVADHRAVDAAAESVEATLGPIDVWVNNAMASVFSPFEQILPDEFDRVTAVTYGGYVHGTRAALRRMLPRDRGVIVQVGSALAYRSIPLQSAYCGAKHAVRGFTDAVRCELRHEGSNVRIGAVHLPAVNTPQFTWVRSRLHGKPQPVAPIYQPEVIARAIVAMTQRPRREMWVGGSTVRTVLANRVAPGLLDRYLARTGYDAQQRAEPDEADRADNLFAPVAGDHGTHGPFDAEATAHSVAAGLSVRRRALERAGAGVVLIAGASQLARHLVRR